ncbi:hypothetical protein [Mycobacterium sp. E1747]|uniref:hypothetical protein n=1 Tax=Mycobacterium sp. E1747 TaxID=1834128 RepID=UPI0007FE2E86|nr:hypothetical protein [Mycobacterium sp. E1747]OBH12441.1 hypothetical protein A5695_16355 [Mycobacterium sp. E1747]
MASLLTACAGFLLAVLWMDLIFDVQVLRFRSPPTDLPEDVLASIAAYYHRATTTSGPMSRLIAVVMVLLVGVLTYECAHGPEPWWVLVLSAVLAGLPIMLALTQTVPDAVRLGRRADGPPEQARLARSVCRDHLVCAGCMFAFVALWVVRSATL